MEELMNPDIKGKSRTLIPLEERGTAEASIFGNLVAQISSVLKKREQSETNLPKKSSLIYCKMNS